MESFIRGCFSWYIRLIGMTFCEILPQIELSNPHYKEHTLYAVGAAWGKLEAMELAGTIVTEAYRATGTTDVAAYLGDDFLDRPEVAGEKLYNDWQ